MKIFLSLFILSFGFTSFASTYQVGSSKTYKSPNELYLADILQDGDIIEIDQEVFVGIDALAVWQQNDLLIRSVGGQAVMDAAGEYIWGKGIWVLAGNNITVEGIEFFGASVPDQNGAGIRLDGVGMTVRNCYFHDNDNGILTNNTYEGEILIEYSEFGYNGFGDGQSHNLYIGHCDKLTFQFNYSHHAHIGHNLKSRADENQILYNRIMDEETGDSSRLIDLSNGGLALIKGNIFMQGDNAPNRNLIGYGLEGLINTTAHEIDIASNTFVNKRTASGLFIDINDDTYLIQVVNNIFAGPSELMNGNSSFSYIDGNIKEEEISNIGFEDEANYNYRLTEGSSAIGIGNTAITLSGLVLLPIYSYVHPLGSENRVIENETIDAGAYEYKGLSSISSSGHDLDLVVFPNPVNDVINVSTAGLSIERIQVFNTNGQLIKESKDTRNIILGGIPSGFYLVTVVAANGHFLTKTVFKQ